MGRPLEKRWLGDTAGAGNQIQVSARPTVAPAANGYIVKQKGSKRFECTNGDGTAVLTLTVGAPDVTQCRITLTDSDGGTYFASKISGRTCTVTRGTGTQFENGTKVAWSFAAPVANVSLQIASA